MAITIKLFASLRERLGRSEIIIDYCQHITVRDIWNDINCEDSKGEVLVAINKTYSSLDDKLSDGDEVAFFPPVTGG